VAFTTLFSYLTKTEEGAQKLKVVMAQAGAVIDIVFDRLIAYYTMLYKALTFDFEGAAVAAKEAFSGFGDELAREVKLAGDLTQQLYLIEEAEEDLQVARAKQNKTLAEKRELLQDENLSIAEKKRILQEVSDAEDVLNNKEIANAQALVDALEKQRSLKKMASNEDNDAIDAANIKLLDLQTQSSQKQIRLKKQINAYDKQAASEAEDRRKEKNAKDEADAEKERVRKAEALAAERKFYEDLAKLQTDDAKRLEDGLISQYEKDWQAAYDYYADLIVLAEKYNLSKAEIDALRAKQTEATLKVETDANQGALDKQAADKAIADAKIKAYDEQTAANKQALAQTTFAVLGALAKDNADAAKAVAVAETIWNTATAIMKTLATGGGFAIPLAVSIGAMGAVQLANILKTEVGGGGGESSITQPTAPVSAGATSAANALQGSQTQQISSIINRQNLNPQRAYVVSTEVTSQQALDRRVRANALFG
jgi:hypothetical protein